MLVRDDFRGKSLVNAVIDLPFALPTIVAGLTLLTLYGPYSPVGIHLAFTRGADRARALLRHAAVRHPHGRSPSCSSSTWRWRRRRARSAPGQFTVFRRIVLPNLLPGILSGSVLALARALGEIGSVVAHRGKHRTTPRSLDPHLQPRSRDSRTAQAAAIAIVLLAAAFVLLLAVGALRFFATRHERA